MKNKRIDIPKHFSVVEAGDFREVTFSLVKQEQTLFELDFTACQFIDSTGLGVLVGLYKKCNENHSKMVLKNVSGDLLNLFKMTRLDQVFTFH
ncbi:STAS domain-containing protein [Fusibacter sp. JL298sf-3]